jgi:hypothetical protein
VRNVAMSHSAYSSKGVVDVTLWIERRKRFNTIYSYRTSIYMAGSYSMRRVHGGRQPDVHTCHPSASLTHSQQHDQQRCDTLLLPTAPAHSDAVPYGSDTHASAHVSRPSDTFTVLQCARGDSLQFISVVHGVQRYVYAVVGQRRLFERRLPPVSPGFGQASWPPPTTRPDPPHQPNILDSSHFGKRLNFQARAHYKYRAQPRHLHLCRLTSRFPCSYTHLLLSMAGLCGTQHVGLPA